MRIGQSSWALDTQQRAKTDKCSQQNDDFIGSGVPFQISPIIQILESLATTGKKTATAMMENNLANEAV